MEPARGLAADPSGHGIGRKFLADPADRPAAFWKRDLRAAYGEIRISGGTARAVGIFFATV